MPINPGEEIDRLANEVRMLREENHMLRGMKDAEARLTRGMKDREPHGEAQMPMATREMSLAEKLILAAKQKHAEADELLALVKVAEFLEVGSPAHAAFRKLLAAYPKT